MVFPRSELELVETGMRTGGVDGPDCAFVLEFRCWRKANKLLRLRVVVEHAVSIGIAPICSA